MDKSILGHLNNAFNDRLLEIQSGVNTNFTPLDLGMPCELLRECGFPDLPIQMAVHRLVDKKLQINHPFSLVSIVNLPECLHDPIAVFQSKTRIDCKVVLTELMEKAVNIVVAIEMHKFCGKAKANSIRSIYPKDNIKDILRWVIEDGLLEYVHKQKFLNWLSKQQSNSADVTKLIKDCTKLIQKIQIHPIK